MTCTLRSGEQLDEVSVAARKQSTVISTRGPLIEQLITGEELCKAACCNLGESSKRTPRLTCPMPMR